MIKNNLREHLGAGWVLGFILGLPLAWAGVSLAEDAPRVERAAGAAAVEAPVGYAAIVPAMRGFVERGEVAGVVTLVMRGGELVHHEAVGMADLERGREMKPDTVFWIASMTKPMTGAALMTLVDEGKVSLDDPVSKHLPEFRDVKLADGRAPATAPTIRHLVTHSSGITEVREFQSVQGATLEQISRAIAAKPLRFEPGTKWSYGSGLSIAGRVIEVASGVEYGEFMRQRLFTPLGMSDTGFQLTPAQHDRAARPYARNKGTGKLERARSVYFPEEPEGADSKRQANPSGGAYSTATDYGRFLQMLLNGGELRGKRVLSAKAVAQMLSPQLPPEVATGFTPGNTWGVGACIVRQPQGVTAMLSPGSCGHGGAYGTQGWIDPTRRMAMVLMISRTNLPNADASDLRGEFQRLAVASAEAGGERP